MGLKRLTRIASFMVIFFFLPSIAVKIWEYLIYAPWSAKNWLIYFLLGVIFIYLIRKNLRKRSLSQQSKVDDSSLLYIAKERLAKGEIDMREFLEIKQELIGGTYPNNSRIKKSKRVITDWVPTVDVTSGPEMEEQEV